MVSNVMHVVFDATLFGLCLDLHDDDDSVALFGSAGCFSVSIHFITYWESMCIYNSWASFTDRIVLVMVMYSRHL